MKVKTSKSKRFRGFFVLGHTKNNNSGRKTVAKIVQRVVKATVDGIVGPQTVTAINCADQELLFNALKIERKVFLNGIIKRRPDQIVFYDGWMNRVNSFNYKAA